MKKNLSRAVLALLTLPLGLMAASPIVIAHRGASGYLPEHTLAAKALAHAMGADYLEQDVVLTKDGVPIILHDIHLDGTTDVEAKFPGRAREDGHYYAIDFTLDEVRQLNAHERQSERTGELVFPQRFGLGLARLPVPTLEEEIDFIQRLNRTTGRNAGLYVELKQPTFHTREGQDIAAIVAELLARYGYAQADDKCYIQCFESGALKQLREAGCELPLVQLIGRPGSEGDPQDDFAAMQTPDGLKQVATYANGLGPSIGQVIAPDEDGTYRPLPLTADAHRAGLVIHPYTLRRDSLPDGISEDDLFKLLFHTAAIDGLFTDFPDDAVNYWVKKGGQPLGEVRLR
ncbi:MAG: glycerophosphodiester phosphodiesterase [Verrucomicrobiota bacterium JB022]|nr:glycerophosphodiester phosphodiesterase [Verrucomicrobiota bacterium JB022]